jgi:TRAP-type mannitol/chloroaromatic compound transport system permease small subunit
VNALLRISKSIDAITEGIGKMVMWLILAAVVISAGNAIMRKAFDIGSNAYLEIQWYLFSAVFMLGSGYVFLRNAHVRIDFVSSKLSKRTNAIIDSLGLVIFIIPLCLILINLSWPVFHRSWVSGEMSQNAGGLIRWPVQLLIPVGFSVLLMQACSELIKRIAFVKGLIPEPFSDDPGAKAAEADAAAAVEAKAAAATAKAAAAKAAVQAKLAKSS